MAPEQGDQSPGYRRGQQRLTGCRGPDGPDQVGGIGVLEDEPAGSGLQRGEDVLVGLEGGHHHHPRTGQGGVGHDRPQRLHPVQAGHPDVEQRHVRTAAADHLQSGAAVGRLADQCQVRLPLDEYPQTHAKERLVVGQDNPDHLAPPGSGSRAVTVKPPPSRGPAVRLPPADSTRSRMPDRPRPPSVGTPPRPRSVTVTTNWPPSRQTVTTASVSPACRSTLVSDSRTTAYTTPLSSAGTPSAAWRSTGRPAARARSTSAASRRAPSAPGDGEASGCAGATASSTTRNSRSARTLVTRIASSDARTCSGCSSRTTRATPACMATTAKPCPATSCTSREIRIRSSSAARAIRSRRACCAAPARTWATAPADPGTTSQVPAHSSRPNSSRFISSASRGSTAITSANAAPAPAGADTRTGRCRATSNIAQATHSSTGPYG